MSEWKSFKLSELGQIIGGSTPSTKNSMNYEGGHISWITPKDLSNHSRRFIAQGARNITEQGLKNCSAQLIPRNSILFSSRAPIGYLAIAEKELCTNQGFKSIVPNDRTNYMFLYYLLKFNKEKIEHISSGTTFKEISGSAMKKFSVCVPPLETQKKIAAVLSAFDNKIELNNAINKNLEEQAQAIFKNMFPAVISNEISIGEYVTPKRGKGLLVKDTICGAVPVVAGGLEPATYHNESNTSAPVLTISASGANAGYVRLWNIPVWSSDSSFIDSSMTEDVYFWYVMLKLRQKEIFDSQMGTAQPHIYPKHIAQLPIKKLDECRVKKFTERITSLFSMIGANTQENKKLGELRDLLLPRLMSGEIDVSAVEI